MSDGGRRITGTVRVEERVRGRVWVAAFIQADGSKTRKTLGPAWVKDSGRKTARGAVVWRAGDGSKPDARYLVPREATDALEVLLAAERGTPGGPRTVTGKTFGDACRAWLEHAERVDGVQDTTLRGYRVIASKLQAEFGPDTLLRRITAGRVERLQDRLLVPTGELVLARSTVRTRMRVLAAILARAKTLGWIGASPVDEVKLIASAPAEPDFNVLEPAQVEAVADAVALITDAELPRMRDGRIDEHALGMMRERRPLWAHAIRLAAYTGLRFGELRALCWRDVDTEGRNLHVRRNAPTSSPAASVRRVRAPKSGRGRSVPLTDQALQALNQIRQAGYRDGPDDLVLPTRGEGMLEVGRVRDAFYRGLREAGLGHLREKRNPMTFHDLRHTFGTLAVRRLPVTDVQAYLGHADIATTMRYVHHVPRHDAARQLSAAFAPGRAGS